MPTSLDWPAITAEAIRHLQDLLRIDTTNPPGNELVAAEYLAGVLRSEGYDPLVLEAAPQRGNLIARLKGDGSLPPLLLYTHLDVVPAEPEHWTHPPFAGEVADGFAWGRGALDMKSVAAMQLMTMLLLKRNAVALRRDVIFAATADEEIDSDVGAEWLVTRHPDLVRAEYGLSETGGYTLYLEGKKFYPVMCAEKGTCWLKIRARGKPGHGSVPHADHAVLHLVRAIERVTSHPLPLHMTATASTYVQRLARSVGGTTGMLLSAVLHPILHDAALKAIPDRSLADALHAIFHNTVSPNQLRAGYKANVIPSEAEAILDGRMLPGFDVELISGRSPAASGRRDRDHDRAHVTAAGSLSRDAAVQPDRRAAGPSGSRRNRSSLYDGRRDRCQTLCQTRHAVLWLCAAQAAAGHAV